MISALFSHKPAIEVFPDKGLMATEVADRIWKVATQSILERGRFTFVLTGGESPVPLYQALASDYRFHDFPWAQTICFFGDERQVPPDDSGSNYRLARETLFYSGLVPEKNILRMKGEMGEASQAADDYETELRYYFPELKSVGQFPRFDLVLLGLGPNGHIASLFPDTVGLEERNRWIISNWIPELDAYRITMTFPVLNAARHVFLQVIDPDKKELVKQILDTDPASSPYPVQRLQPSGEEYIWFLTKEVACDVE